MSYFTVNYPSDSDEIQEIPEEQLEYEYADEDIDPMDENLVNDYAGYAGVTIDSFERMRDQTMELDGHNWALRQKCIAYEQKLRIKNRSATTRIKDKIRYWKKMASRITRKTKSWLKRLGRKPTDEYVCVPRKMRYRDMLEEKYYPRDLNLEPEEDPEDQDE